jgi:dimethylaniline monooxygenase (N-oxide forming)
VTPDGIVSGDQLLPADVLVFATGYEKDFLGLKEEEDGVWLYRSILVPGLTNFATIGFAQSIVTLLACNMQATWLAEVLRGSVHLPSHEVMQKDVDTRKRYQKKVYANAESNYAWIDQHLIGLLLADMKIQERRADTLLKHWFFPLNPTDYKLVVTHRV